jgi:CRP/FNR family cyclic AMP-dependent transcriptional regulator
MSAKAVKPKPRSARVTKAKGGRKPAPRRLPFDAQQFLDSAGLDRTVVDFASGAVVFSQGDPAAAVYYIQNGAIRLSVLSESGREAVIANLGPGDFFGEGCLAGQPVRMGTARASIGSTVLLVAKPQMMQLLHEEATLSDRFLAHLLTRNIRIEEDLVDQLFNSSEKRLARALLLLARYGKDDTPVRKIPKMSQELLAEMVGTTRSRVNFFMNKFRKLGFIEYNGGLTINKSLLSVVLHD